MTDCDGCVPGARTLDRFWLRARIIRSDFRWRRCQRRREIGLAHDVVRVEKYFVCSAREECAGKGFANACVRSASGGREREKRRETVLDLECSARLPLGAPVKLCTHESAVTMMVAEWTVTRVTVGVRGAQGEGDAARNREIRGMNANSVCVTDITQQPS